MDMISMLVHLRVHVPQGFLLHCPKILCHAKRGTVRVNCLAQEHNTVTLPQHDPTLICTA